jgi:hypothetical protein
MYIAIDTVGQDRELKDDELNIEENDHDPGMTSVGTLEGLYPICFDEV